MMGFTSRVPWRQKIEHSPEPRIVQIEPGRSRAGSGRMLISSPIRVEEIVKAIPEGEVMTIGQIRRKLADEARADFTCPITTGIFLKIIAYASEDEFLRSGEGAPYWRVVQNNGNLNEGFPGGANRQASLLERDGVRVERNTRGRIYVELDGNGRLAGKNDELGPNGL